MPQVCASRARCPPRCVRGGVPRVWHRVDAPTSACHFAQGVWHQVHSLDVHNVSVNLLFAPDHRERASRPRAGGGTPSPPAVGRLAPSRRPPALAELAKVAESIAAQVAGPSRMHQVLAALAHGEADQPGPAALPCLVLAPLAPPPRSTALTIPGSHRIAFIWTRSRRRASCCRWCRGGNLHAQAATRGEACAICGWGRAGRRDAQRRRVCPLMV